MQRRLGCLAIFLMQLIDLEDVFSTFPDMISSVVEYCYGCQRWIQESSKRVEEKAVGS